MPGLKLNITLRFLRNTTAFSVKISNNVNYYIIFILRLQQLFVFFQWWMNSRYKEANTECAKRYVRAGWAQDSWKSIESRQLSHPAHENTTWCGCQMSARTTQNMCRAIHTVHLAPNMLVCWVTLKYSRQLERNVSLQLIIFTLNIWRFFIIYFI